SVRTSPLGPITEATGLSFVTGGLPLRPQRLHVRPPLLMESQERFPWNSLNFSVCGEFLQAPRPFPGKRGASRRSPVGGRDACLDTRVVRCPGSTSASRRHGAAPPSRGG